MKVLMINGSPREDGCTYTALSEMAKAFAAEGAESEILHVGKEALHGCRACGGCWKAGKCVIDDCVNEALGKAAAADGFVFGSPVHYAAATGPITTFLHRFAYASGGQFTGKPGTAIVSARRAGTTAALDQLNKYFPILGMIQPPSQYWNMVHGSKPEDVLKDEEGLQTMRVLARNMVWLMRCLEAGKAAGIAPPEREQRAWTNFIREV